MATSTMPTGAVAGERRLRAAWETPPTFVGQLSTVDHKIVGKRYLVTAMLFLILGGAEAAVMRWQLAGPNRHVVSPEAYNQLFTMHGITMIFWYAAPVLSGFSNYIWPLMLGSRDMAFPRLNAFSYWSFLFSGIFLYSSVLVGQAPDAAWVSYVPLTEPRYDAGLNIQFYTLSLLLLTISTTVGAVNFLVTAIKLRAPGMTVSRIPIFIWGTLTASGAILLALPSLTVACVFLFFEHRLGMHFFDPTAGGYPVLWQHLFWMFGHPWVYVVVLPGMGMVSMIIPTFSRRPLVAHTWVVTATVGTGAIGFTVWLHHMFAVGASMTGITFFSGMSMFISIPSAVAIWAWLATLWKGRLVLRTPMLFAMGFLLLFVIGGVSGVVTAAAPFDWQVTDTYFIVADLHYVLIGINLFPVIGAMYYWLPKMTGRLLSERLGVWNFWVMFIGFNVAFFPMHIAGLLGMPRRIFTYPVGTGWDTSNLVSTIGAYLFTLGILLFFINVFWSWRAGALAGDNPWDASSLEWSTSSPPPPYNFAAIPVVRSREPLWETRLGEPASQRTTVPKDNIELTDGRETPSTTPVDAAPSVVLHMPEDTVWPLVTALGILGGAYALVSASWWMAAVALLWIFISIVGWLWPEAHPHPNRQLVTGS